MKYLVWSVAVYAAETWTLTQADVSLSLSVRMRNYMKYVMYVCTCSRSYTCKRHCQLVRLPVACCRVRTWTGSRLRSGNSRHVAQVNSAWPFLRGRLSKYQQKLESKQAHHAMHCPAVSVALQC